MPETNPAHQCDGTFKDPDDANVILRCTNIVVARRPSTSGKHFCPAKRCQSSKQRFYRTLRLEQAKLAGRDVIAALIATLVQPDNRSTCPACGHEDALVGWAHRNAPGGGPCFGLGNMGPGLPPGLLDIIHPGRAPGSQD